MVRVLVGSDNRTAERNFGDCGIAVYSFDEASRAVELLGVEAGIDNPAYLAVADDCVYAVSEVLSWQECTVSAYRLDAGEGRLTFLNKQPTRGLTSCHVAVLPGKRLVVANYSDGAGGPDQAVCFYPLAADGLIGSPDGSAAHRGEPGADPERQARSHAHCTVASVDGRAALVADLGLDSVIVYAAEAPVRELCRLRLPAGHGPRHIAVHPNGRTVYVLNELQPLLSVLDWDGARLTHERDVETLGEQAGTTASAGAAIQLSPDARFLYTSTRGPDCLTVFALGEAGTTPERVEVVPCGGRWPRDLGLTPSGAHLIVANQFSDALAIFARDAATGRLSDTGGRIAVRAPKCVKALAVR